MVCGNRLNGRYKTKKEEGYDVKDKILYIFEFQRYNNLLNLFIAKCYLLIVRC